MGKVKQKAFKQILAYSRIFWHNQVHSGVFQAYSESCVTLAYSQPEANTELIQTSTMERFAEIVNCYSYFRKLLFSQYQLFMFSV